MITIKPKVFSYTVCNSEPCQSDHTLVYDLCSLIVINDVRPNNVLVCSILLSISFFDLCVSNQSERAV